MAGPTWRGWRPRPASRSWRSRPARCATRAGRRSRASTSACGVSDRAREIAEPIAYPPTLYISECKETSGRAAFVPGGRPVIHLQSWLADFWPDAIRIPDPAFWAALLLVAGALAGEAIARWSRLPRVVGYSAAGCLAALAGLGPGMPLDGAARLIVDVALALLLFEIGSRVRLRWLRHNPALLLTSLAESLLGAGAVYFALRWIDLEPAVAAACAVLAMPASAAVAGRVALELGAQGQVTDRMILLTALNTLYAVLALTLLEGWWNAGHAADVTQSLGLLARSFFGSLLLAALLAGVVSIVARRLDLRNESSVLLVLGLVVLALGGARAAGLSTLLVPLLAGLLLGNVTDRPWVWPRHFGTAGGVVVLMMFVIVGASWSPAVLAAGGLAALVLVAARSAAKGAVVLLLCRPAGASLRQGLALAVTLTPL
ncbi:MAG: cation:proton antiporter, partial [Burkholderiales bacterium]|nr:cation:proton antiporter [Burkholderiales bacterium]